MTLRITFTGIDEQTDLAEVRRLLLCQPGVEIGILATATPEDRPRYPRLGWITEAVRYLSPQVAVHFCGRIRKALMADYGPFEHWFGVFGARRLQVNGALTIMETSIICSKFSRFPVITQHTEANSHLAEADVGLNHQLLVDGSGGRGLVPCTWSKPRTWKEVGFAGGLGAETLPVELPKILAVAGNGAWIDMESRLRNRADRFDINLAELALHTFTSALSVKGPT